MLSVCRVLLVAVFASLCLGDSVWDGSYTDNVLGISVGTTYLCTESDQIQGVFSDIGWIQGTIDGLNATGFFGVSGYNDDTYGGFNWTILEDGSAFSGVYWYHDEPCILYPWATDSNGLSTPNTKNSTNATLQECQYVFSNIPAHGVWTSGNGDNITICFNSGPNQFYGSATGTFNAYLIGTAFYGGTILTFSYFTGSNSVNGSSGIGMIRIQGNQLTLNRYDGISTADELLLGTYFLNTYNLTSNVPQNASSCLLNVGYYGPVWQGAWTDVDFGFGRTYLCVEGNTVQGVFSEVGVIQGTIDPTGYILTGVFHDSGEQLYGDGTFVLQMDAPGQNIYGSWQFTYQGVNYTWVDSRVDVNTPTGLQCLSQFSIASQNLTLQGEWVLQLSNTTFNNLTLDICFIYNQNYRNFSNYLLSYDDESGQIRGYGDGRVLNNGTLLRGEWFETNGTGIDLYQIAYTTGTMFRFVWPNENLQTVQYFPCYNCSLENAYFDLHSVQQYNYTYGNLSDVTLAVCNRNSDLFITAGQNPTKSPTPTRTPKFQGTHSNYTLFGEPATASALSASLAFVLLAGLALLLF